MPSDLPEMPDPMDERFRWCKFCKADCWPDPEFQEHADDCPTVTGVWPVIPEEFPHGLRCCRCDEEITDTYRHIKVRDGDGKSIDSAPMMEVVCEDCAIESFVAGEKPEEADDAK